jgi:alpha-mannosidase
MLPPQSMLLMLFYLLWAPFTVISEAADAAPLWELGQPDQDTREFALGPRGYNSFQREFTRDSFFVIGLSDPAKDWPYVHPGPLDYWGGNRQHAFSVLFALDLADSAAGYRLVLDLVDSHYDAPPQLLITCNDHEVARPQVEAGASDRSLVGHPTEGRPSQVIVEISPQHFREGVNRIDIESIDGSWMLYDCLRLEGPPDARCLDMPDGCYEEVVTPRPCVARVEGEPKQLILLDLIRTGAPVRAECRINGRLHTPIDLTPGRQEIEIYVPPVSEQTPLAIELAAEGKPLLRVETTVDYVRPWEVHLLHFSHLDIGYTHKQDEVQRLQVQYIEQALELIDETADYPVEAQFRWVPEGLWAVESFLDQADDASQRAFLKAVEADRIWLPALYDQPLTGLHCDEELLALVDYGVRLQQQFGVAIDAAMITDVPGYTWGMVTTLAQSGVRYLSLCPNPSWRIGRMRIWDDRPFYWVAPNGEEKLLCWMSGGYGWFRSGLAYDLEERLTKSRLLQHLDELQTQGYPYDLLQLRYDVHADNGYPDPTLPDTVRRWNERFISPQLVISTPSLLFPEFEERYGDHLPVVQGDFTPYWEDGAASTASDTALSRRAAERLIQAQALWAMLDPAAYPGDLAHEGWREVLLYDEHTWGAWNSVIDPDSDLAVSQAARKHEFLLEAVAGSWELLHAALEERRAANREVRAIEVFNTCSWSRTDLVTIPKDMDLVGDRLTTVDGAVVPTQRLATGELAFLAVEVPALGSTRYLIEPKPAVQAGEAVAVDATLSNGLLCVELDPETGVVTALRSNGSSRNLIDTSADAALNEYIYVTGITPDEQQRIDSDALRVEVVDAGPLAATIRVTSTAPGAQRLEREVRLIDGLNRLDVTNTIDKNAVRTKEAVHFVFPFQIADPEVHLDMPWAVVRPEKDQVPGACKNYFSVQRWVDVSNLEHGVTVATVDAPLVQIGEIRTDIGPFVNNADSFLNHIDPSATLYSYVMNNYWETNYKADQEGEATFAYSIQPHWGPYNQTESARFGIERSRPLIVVPASVEGPSALASLFTLDAPGVIATAVKPSREGKYVMIRLFAASGKPEEVRIDWADQHPSAVYYSDLRESQGELAPDVISLPAYGVTTLRAEYGVDTARR